jgi:hypothetical protein
MRSVQILPTLRLDLNADSHDLKKSEYCIVTWWSDYRRGLDWLTDLFHIYTTHYFISKSTIGHTRSSQSVIVFTSRCLVAANVGRSPSSWFPIGPWSQLPASNSNSAQQLNPSGCLANSKTLQPINRLQSQKCFATGGLQPINSSWRQPLETHDQKHFFNWTLAVIDLCNTLSVEKLGLSLMNTSGLSSSVRVAHTASYWEFFLLHYKQFLYQYRLCKADHAYHTGMYLMLQQQLSHK